MKYALGIALEAVAIVAIAWLFVSWTLVKLSEGA
jgi:hypothetical protein